MHKLGVMHSFSHSASEFWGPILCLALSLVLWAMQRKVVPFLLEAGLWWHLKQEIPTQCSLNGRHQMGIMSCALELTWESKVRKFSRSKCTPSRRRESSPEWRELKHSQDRRQMQVTGMHKWCVPGGQSRTVTFKSHHTLIHRLVPCHQGRDAVTKLLQDAGVSSILAFRRLL